MGYSPRKQGIIFEFDGFGSVSGIHSVGFSSSIIKLVFVSGFKFSCVSGIELFVSFTSVCLFSSVKLGTPEGIFSNSFSLALATDASLTSSGILLNSSSLLFAFTVGDSLRRLAEAIID